MLWLMVRNVLKAAIAETFVRMLDIGVLPLLVRENKSLRDIRGTGTGNGGGASCLLAFLFC
jgi:hypothetical protein